MTVGVQTARDGLRDYIDAALIEGQRTVIERHNRPVAVIVSVEDAQALFELDERPELRAEIRSVAKPILPSEKPEPAPRRPRSKKSHGESTDV